ncbi:3-keto-5-aminohexanoate cleavage protein [Amylibacter ulvae]|uniref:3-keto-5-aminohexanoate cleavage protein n=1 Tax=Paramylibacter ulvae TaxID=1651968 RepID=A0ABQ3D4E8_9RHOB|nr:3-keto-5-aminohexanoate cleavage protein [Amylibacter ulvae]GHA58353.1 3-keto-5-aminohexanoate cleavage protein [Amylibacter ulvae]
MPVLHANLELEMSHPTLMVAPNGARKQKSDHPALPVSLDEIVQCAAECYDAGADILHLHVRNDDGSHSLDAGRYRETIAGVAERVPDMPIQITTESGGIFDVHTQLRCLQDTRPHRASVSIREIARSPDLASHVYGFAKEACIDVQHIIYGLPDIAQYKHWVETAIIPETMNSVIFVLGQYTPPINALPDDLLPFLDAANNMSLEWAVCAFGQNELACAQRALQRGGNIRIGFENNLHLPDGTLAQNNAQTVALARALINEI